MQHLIPFDNNPVEVYSSERHAALRFHIHQGFQFARKWPFVPVAIQEVKVLAKSLPVLFYKDSQGAMHLAALLLTKQGHIVTPTGNFAISRPPIIMQLYPFTWHANQNQMILALYQMAPHFSGKGEKLFTSHKKPTQRMRQIMAYLNQARAMFDSSQPTLNNLAALDIFKSMVITLSDGQASKSITFYIIDTDKLNQANLSQEQIPLVAQHLQSLSHLPEAAASEKKPPLAEKMAAESTQTLEEVVAQVCATCQVSLAEIKGRKRTAEIIQARVTLASQADSLGMLEQLALQLERTPATLRKWKAMSQ